MGAVWAVSSLSSSSFSALTIIPSPPLLPPPLPSPHGVVVRTRRHRVVVVRVGFVVVVGARCAPYVVAAVVCVGARCAPCVVAVLCAVVVVGPWWLARSGGRGDSTELTRCSFLEGVATPQPHTRATGTGFAQVSIWLPVPVPVAKPVPVMFTNCR